MSKPGSYWPTVPSWNGQWKPGMLPKPNSSVLHIGCAGWALPGNHLDAFPVQGTHLERYAHRFPAVEINSSFYRPHRPNTYARWADSVPDDFRFAVKFPKELTHTRRLEVATGLLDRFLSEIGNLGPKLGPLLVQLPPSLPFDKVVAGHFFRTLRERFDGDLVLEPRHPSWFAVEAERLLGRHRVARVAADPAIVPNASTPGGWNGLVYYRLHGSPKMYYSAYSDAFRKALAQKLKTARDTGTVWCVFDNTAEGAATANALDVLNLCAARKRT